MDIGLLGAQSNLSPKVLLEDHHIFSEFKGALIENFVAQEFLATGEKDLFYWASEGSAEVGFLIQKDQNVYPLEVKSGNIHRKKSLKVYGEKYDPVALSRATAMNLKHDGNIYNYPLYLISRFLLK